MKSLFRKKNVGQILDEIKRNEESSELSLKKNLKLRDLVSLGIAAIVGAGIFSTIGNAAFNGGPAVVFLFVFTAIACLFSALCYAEFASTIPISGSAYTYAYTTFGELMAWVLGWALVMEYAVGNIAVAISWSDYFTGFLAGLGLKIPEYLTMDYLSASRGFEAVSAKIAGGETLNALTRTEQETYLAWQNAPSLGGSLKFIADLPALLVTFAITALVFVGIKESKNAGNIMVLIKIAVVLLVIVVGAFYIQPENWSPFAPNGITGVMQGVSAVFFAYIGFDAISTTAEECENPQKDLPKAMVYSLIICTVLYILIALVLTGMVSYTTLAVGDPLAFVFEQNQLNFMAGIVALSAIVAMTSVFLVFQLGQPRILMTMSRDGLLPKSFSKIHPRFKTPYVSTIATGLLVAIPALMLNLTEVTDLTSIGTLFAFAIVSGGVLFLETSPDHDSSGRFKIPYINSQFIVPSLLLISVGIAYYYNPQGVINFITFQDEGEGALMGFYHRIPLWFFVIFSIFLSYHCFTKKLSLVPVMGILTNFYLMTELGVHNWVGFGLWMLVGLVIYFGFGYRNSKLRNA